MLLGASTTLQKHTSAPWSRSEPLWSDLLAVGCDTGSGRRASGRRKEGGREEEVGGEREEKGEERRRKRKGEAGGKEGEKRKEKEGY